MVILLPVSAVLPIRNVVHPENKVETCHNVCEAAQEVQKVTSVLLDQAVGRMKKQLNLWSHKINSKAFWTTLL